MLLDAHARFLVLEDGPKPQERSVRLADTLADAVSSWTSGSRLSPVWALDGDHDRAFHGLNELVFLGPVAPAEPFADIESLASSGNVATWLTAGCFNILLRIPISTTPPHVARDVVEWAMAKGLTTETWRIRNGLIEDMEFRTNPNGAWQPIIDSLASAASRNRSPVLRTSFDENVVVTATTLTRAATIHPPLFKRLAAIAEAARDTTTTFLSGGINTLEMQSRLMSMNAALSRFSSQAFSGVPPIAGTECHFWTHSLLGTGSANIALDGIVNSIQVVLGEARLPERLVALGTKTNMVPDKIRLVSDASLLSFDIIRETDADPILSEPIVPLVTYFSGRDGFSSQLQSLSAPLTTVAECNSRRSNLLTITHEISHIFVQSALANVAPSLSVATEMDEARRVAASGFKARNHLEAARQLVVEGVIAMEQSVRDLDSRQVNAKLPDLFERWRNEMQEILVHAFDFLYFHQGDPEFYVTSIWHSWCSIPGISDRVPEYLMRTLCAVAAKLLAQPSSSLFQSSIDLTASLLRKVEPKIDPSSNYVDQALRLLDRLASESDFRGRFEKEFSARLYLVRLVRIYLFSDTLAARLFADPYSRSGSAADKRKLHYDLTPIGNALTFVKDHLKDDPSEAESLWVLHTLAFDLKAAGPAR
jgi:hypothetical protein